MTKALLKKQWKEILSFLTQSGKKGKRRGKGSLFLYGLLFLYVGAAVMVQFALVFHQLCRPLAEAGLTWLYFALAGLFGTVLTVVGGIFLAQSQLFEAKDNELLLSLPLPFSRILLCRMVPLYAQNFLFEALVLIPSLAVYGVEFGLSFGMAPAFVSILFFLPLLGLVLTCALGWLSALISSRTRHKSLMTVVISLCVLAAYSVFLTQMNRYLGLLIAEASAVGEKARWALYPFYLLGRGMEGSALSLALVIVMILGLFAATCALLAKSFWRIAAGRGGKKAKYRESFRKVRTVKQALLGKERRRFVRSSAYLLNCGLGSLLLLAGGIAALVKGREALAYLRQMGLPEKAWPVLACAAVCLVGGMNLVSAPSISLEGSSLWLLRSLPVSGGQILWGKLRLHLWVTAPAALLCGLALDVALVPGPISAVLLPIVPVLFVLVCGELGLLINLRFPNLNGSTETTVIKQSASTTFTLFSAWGLIAAFAGIYFLAGSFLGSAGFLLLCGAVLAAAALGLGRFLKTWGVKQWETL